MGRWYRRKCCVPGCSSTEKNADGITLHQFPSQLPMKVAWFTAVGNPAMKVKGNMRICSKHFTDQDYWPTYASGKRSLRPNVVPSIFSVGDESLKKSGSCSSGDQEIDSTGNPEESLSQTNLPDGTICEFYEEDSPIGDVQEIGDTLVADSNLSQIQIGKVLGANDLKYQLSTRKRKISDEPHAHLDGLKSSKILAQLNSQELKTDGTITSKISIDFDAIDSALKLDSIKLPSSRWSYTRLGSSCIMFLCWDNDLRLIKRAVLKRGSQLSLYLGDQLLADGSTDGLTHDLEGCLRILDMFEHCQGLNGMNVRWSNLCGKYLCVTDGNQVCDACQKESKIVDGPAVGPLVLVPTVECERSKTLPMSDQNGSKPQSTQSLNTGNIHSCINTTSIINKIPISTNNQNASTPLEPGKFNGRLLATLNLDSKPSQAPIALVNNSNVEVAAVCPTFDPRQNASASSTNVATKPGYLVVDFVMPGGSSPIETSDLQKQVLALTKLQSLQATMEKQRRVGGVCWVDESDESIKRDLRSSQKQITRTQRSQKPDCGRPTPQKSATRKATARKSTGGPRKSPMNIETEDPKPYSELDNLVESEVNKDEMSENNVTSSPVDPSCDPPKFNAQPSTDSQALGAKSPNDSPECDGQPTTVSSIIELPKSDSQPDCATSLAETVCEKNKDPS